MPSKIAARWQQADEARAQYEAGLRAIVANDARAAVEFNDIKTVEDVARLISTDPARAKRFQQLHQRMQVVSAELQTVRAQAAQQAAQQQAAQFEAFAAQHDKLAEQIIPELAPNASPRVTREIQEASVAALQHCGFIDPELRAGWSGKQSFSLRDARGCGRMRAMELVTDQDDRELRRVVKFNKAAKVLNISPRKLRALIALAGSLPQRFFNELSGSQPAY